MRRTNIIDTPTPTILLLLLLPVFIVAFVRGATAIGPPAPLLDEIVVEDYSAGDPEPSRPDDVDNEIIQSLVDKFLNKGANGNGGAGGGGGDGKMAPDDDEPLNKEAQKLVNSSFYWNTQNLKADASIVDARVIETWLSGYSSELQKVLHQVAVAGWNYFASASLSTKVQLDEAEEVARLFLKTTALQARQFNASAFPYGTIERIQLAQLAQQGMNALSDAQLSEYNKDLLAINQIFANAPICENGYAPSAQNAQPQHGLDGDEGGSIGGGGGSTRVTGCMMRFNDLQASLQQPNINAAQILNLWSSWRLSAGPNLTQHYQHLVGLTNRGAQLNAFADAGAMWQSVFELPEQTGWYAPGRSPAAHILAQLETVYEQIRPLYEQLHAFVRARVAAIYRRQRGGVGGGSAKPPAAPPAAAAAPTDPPTRTEDEAEAAAGTDDDKSSSNNIVDPASAVTRDGPIPIHLLKSLNGDSWSALYEQTRPFGEESIAEGSGDAAAAAAGGGAAAGSGAPMAARLSDELLDQFRRQNYTVRTMFAKVQRFMRYLGFDALPRTFWTESIFTRNWSKDTICNPATHYDMVDGSDYRVKICGQLSEADFVQAHRLMARLHYAFASRQQPVLLRDAPNPSLSAALAGAFSIVALNPDYLRAQKLIGARAERSEQTELNRLYREALDDLVGMPFALVADRWRYTMFAQKARADLAEEAGEIEEQPSPPTKDDDERQSGSALWWELRRKYQGVAPPQRQSSPVAAAVDPHQQQQPAAAVLAAAFDAVASPAIAQQQSPAARNFLAYVAQFQVLEQLCGGPGVALSQGCTPSPNALKSVIGTLRRGGSMPWLDAFEGMTGQRQLDAGPLLRYYSPLYEWLKATNEREGRVIGWSVADDKAQLFAESELPELAGRSDFESDRQFGPADDAHLAYPGQSCASGQECLLDSQCNGTVCVCRQGMYTLRIADTYNCVSGDPAKVGLVDDNGGLVITLTPNNTTMPTTLATEEGGGGGAEETGDAAESGGETSAPGEIAGGAKRRLLTYTPTYGAGSTHAPSAAGSSVSSNLFTVALTLLAIGVVFSPVASFGLWRTSR